MNEMCGIAGISLVKSEEGSPSKAAIAMLRAIEHRGPDATGAAWVDASTGEVMLQKEAVPAHRFVRSLNMHGARTAILHTRWATKGSPSVAENNHPIDVHGIVGVHNGMLRNDDVIFDLIDAERFGQVDSEAAFALLNVDDDMSVPDRLSLLDGSAALAWLEVDDEGLSDRVLHLARVRHSPLFVAQTAKGSTLFASTRTAIFAGVQALGLHSDETDLPFLSEIAEGTYLRIRRGIIIEWATIPSMIATSRKGLTK